MLIKPFGFAGAGEGGIGYGDPIYNTGVIVYYDFGDATAGSYREGGGVITDGDTAFDLSGNGYDSTLVASSQQFEYITSQSRGVVRTFSKNGGRWEMDDLAGAQLGLTAFSFEYVLRAEGMVNDNVLHRFSGTGTPSRFETNLQQYSSSPPKRISAELITEQDTNIASALSPQAIDNGYHHLVYTAKVGSPTRIYFDGSEIGSGSVNWPGGEDVDFDETNAWMGATNNPGLVYNGDILVFRIYDNALTAADVTSNFNYYDGVIGF
tara:strand:- start:223 stop:1017 length:795 start_codon:yes stop_codon:yes gene_type:complete